jgi:hypothetical protein
MESTKYMAEYGECEKIREIWELREHTAIYGNIQKHARKNTAIYGIYRNIW